MGNLPRRWKRRLKSVRFTSGALTTGGFGIVGGGAGVLTGAGLWGWLGIALGIGLWAWAIRINGYHFWKPWWRGRPFPLRITAGKFNLNFEPGSVVSGIKWEKGFSKVWVKIENNSEVDVESLDMLIEPPEHIARSRVKSDFVDCRIAPTRSRPTVTAVVKKGGESVALEIEEDSPGNYFLAPHHRLQCGKVPIGAVIQVTLATINVKELADTKPEFTPTLKEGLRYRALWHEDGWAYVVEEKLDLKISSNADHKTSSRLGHIPPSRTTLAR